MDEVIEAMGTSLEDLKDLGGNRLSWKESIYVVTKSQHTFHDR